MRDVPKALPITPEQAEVAGKMMDLLDGRQFSDIAAILGACLFSVGAANAWLSGDAPDPDGEAFAEEIGTMLLQQHPEAVWMTPGTILVKLGKQAKEMERAR